MQDQTLIYTMPLNVRYGEVGPDGLAQLSALANWLQEAAGQSADTLGFGERKMTALGIGWILTRLVLRLHRLPGAGESIAVRTWPSHHDHLAHRGYEVVDSAGNTLVTGASAWIVMEMATRHMEGFPPALQELYPTNPPECEAFTTRTLPRLQNALYSAPILARRDDLDLNGHVNNARYLPWLLECLPPVHITPAAGQTAPNTPDEPSYTAECSPIPHLIDISFRAECFPGDSLVCLCGAPAEQDTKNPRLIHALRRNTGEGDKQEDVCRAVTYWNTLP